MRTKQETIDSLNALSNRDKELAHSDSDDLMLEALRLAGWNDVAEAYDAARDRIGFWYA